MMKNEPEREKNSSGVAFEVDLFRPEDADGIVRLFQAVYGDGYPIRVFYDAKTLTDANEKGDYHSIVARKMDGEIIGVHHLYPSAPNRAVYEWGVGLVLKAYRGEGVSDAIGRHVIDVAASKLSLDVVFGESVCNHLHTQKQCARAGFVETAIEVALMPAEAYSHEKSATGRVATLLQFRCYKPKSRTVFLPDAYERPLRFMYEESADPPLFDRSDKPLPSNTSSHLEMNVFDFAKVARIAAYRVGSDFDDRLGKLEAEALAQGVLVFQVWLKLSSSSVGAAVERLRKRGYFLGGLLLRWFDNDGLLMQKLMCDPDFEAINLHSRRAEKILDVIIKDRDRIEVG
jgi:hypothetical protein